MTRASLLLCVITLASACTGRPEWADGQVVTENWPADARPQDLGHLEGRLLSLHNRTRAEAGVMPIAWDAALARAAAGYAEELTRIGRLQHSAGQNRAGQGENLWMGTRGAYTVEEMVGT